MRRKELNPWTFCTSVLYTRKFACKWFKLRDAVGGSPWRGDGCRERGGLTSGADGLLVHEC